MASLNGHAQRPRVLLGLTGSVASIRAPLLIQQLSEFADVQVVATQPAFHFFDEKTLEAKTKIWRDVDEYETWKQMGDPVLHIDLRKWADLFLIAPLSANTLAKMVNGLSDNLLTCVVRAWSSEKPLLVAPAMNTLMWEHPITQKQLGMLQELSVDVIPPIQKLLACGDYGFGAMAEVDAIVSTTRQKLQKPTP